MSRSARAKGTPTRTAPVLLARALPALAIIMMTAACSSLQEKGNPVELYAAAVAAQENGATVADALNLYEKAASAGSARAQLVVALHQATRRLPESLGESVVRTETASSPWFESALAALERAAQAGDADALTLAGLMHYAGTGTTRNPRRADEMLASAAGLGSAEAHYWLGRIAEEARRYDRAAVHYERAIDGGHTHAYLNLAMLHVYGRAPGASYARGMAILRIAQEKEVPTAASTFASLLERNESAAREGSYVARNRIREMRQTGLAESGSD